MRYIKITEIKNVSGFNPKTGDYAYQADGKGYIRFGNTLLEREETPLHLREQGKYTYVWYCSGKFELYQGDTLLKSIENDTNLLNKDAEYIGYNRLNLDDYFVYFNIMSPFDAQPILKQDLPCQLHVENDIIIAYNNLKKEEVCRVDWDGTILWSFPFKSLGEDNVYSPGKVDSITNILGVVGDLLWFKTDFARLIALDVATGKLVYQLSCNVADKDKPQYKMVEGIGRCYLREEDKAIVCISSFHFQVIAPYRGEVIECFAFREEDPEGIGRFDHIFGPLLQGDYFTFLAVMDTDWHGIGRVGIFDYKARKLVWTEEIIPPEERKATRNRLVPPQTLYMSGDKLYIKDIKDTLHIFQRE